MRGINKLSATKAARLDKPGRYGDGGGLWLQVSKWGTKAWLFRYQLNGRARQMGLGSFNTFSLKEARERARFARQQVADGIDPIEVRRDTKIAARLAAARAITFEQCANRYIAAQEAGWKNAKHKWQWRRSLELYADPIMSLPVAQINTPLVIKCLEDAWQTRTETASRVRQRIERILDWATVSGFRVGENPARWKGHLENVLPNKSKIAKVQHLPAMPYADLPEFIRGLRRSQSVSSLALEFTILTAARTGEVIGAGWPEIDFEQKVWTVPAERMKSEREHRVPLTARAIKILNSVPRIEGNEFAFPGAREGRPLSNMAMLELLRGMDGNGLTVHGFRSTFRDWAAEQTNFPREIAEAALAHLLKDKTEAAYQRGDLLEKRRRLMSVWARYCESPATQTSKVVAIGSAA